MDFELRPIGTDEYLAFGRAAANGFAEHAKDEELEDERALLEFDRTLAAFDGGRIVGTGAVLSFELTVPGENTVSAGGVSWITVLPTHTRRGILTSIMRTQLADIAERGEPLAMLWASESTIYGRFGYGVGTQHIRFEIDTRHRDFVRSPAVTGTVALIDKDTAAKVLPDVFERARTLQPGAIARSQAYWDFHLRDFERWWEGAGPRFYVTYTSEAGEIDGYVSYRVKSSWEGGQPNSTLKVEDFCASTAAARAALWAYCLDVDLITTLDAWCAVDEPLRWMLADPRRMRVTRLSDGLWIRPVDIPAMLSARRYSVEGDIRIGITDPFVPENNGCYLLSASPSGADCRKDSGEPDLHMQVSDLGSAYLGGVSFSTLSRAGRVEACSTEGLRIADALFASDRAPFCDTGF